MYCVFPKPALATIFTYIGRENILAFSLVSRQWNKVFKACVHYYNIGLRHVFKSGNKDIVLRHLRDGEYCLNKALSRACRYKIDIIEYLIERGACDFRYAFKNCVRSRFRVDRFFDMDIIYYGVLGACAGGNLAFVKKYEDFANIREKINAAIKYGHRDIIDFYLEKNTTEMEDFDYYCANHNRFDYIKDIASSNSLGSIIDISMRYERYDIFDNYEDESCLFFGGPYVASLSAYYRYCSELEEDFVYDWKWIGERSDLDFIKFVVNCKDLSGYDFGCLVAGALRKERRKVIDFLKSKNFEKNQTYILQELCLVGSDEEFINKYIDHYQFYCSNACVVSGKLNLVKKFCERFEVKSDVLDTAAEYNHYDICKFLLDNYPNMQIKSVKCNIRILRLIEEKSHKPLNYFDIFSRLAPWEHRGITVSVIKYLAKHITVNKAFLLCCFLDDIRAAEYFRELGANNFNQTLATLVRPNNIVVEYLINCGANNMQEVYNQNHINPYKDLLKKYL